MSPITFRGLPPGSPVLRCNTRAEGKEGKTEGKTIDRKPVRAVPPWEHCAFLPSSRELGDEINRQVRRQIRESPVCQVFFSVRPNHDTRFSDVARVRLCQCGLTSQEVENALVLSNDESEIMADAIDGNRYCFVASLKVNQWLETLTERKSGSFKKIDWTLEPDELFEYYSNRRSAWRPAQSSRAAIPLILLDPRYIGFTAPTVQGGVYPNGFARAARYVGDAVTRCLAETMSVFCYALHTDRAEGDKVSEMKMLLSPGVFHSASRDSDDTDNNPGATRLSAREFLERIKSAPGGFAYLSLFRDKPVYQASALDVSQVRETDRYLSNVVQSLNLVDPEPQSARERGFCAALPDELSRIGLQRESTAANWYNNNH